MPGEKVDWKKEHGGVGQGLGGRGWLGVGGEITRLKAAV